MSLVIKPAPVKKTLVVAASPQRAFDVFTAGFDRWWPRSHSIGESPLKAASATSQNWSSQARMAPRPLGSMA